eukprot:6474495-Amphidinium_carterae.4
MTMEGSAVRIFASCMRACSSRLVSDWFISVGVCVQSRRPEVADVDKLCQSWASSTQMIIISTLRDLSEPVISVSLQVSNLVSRACNFCCSISSVSRMVGLHIVRAKAVVRPCAGALAVMKRAIGSFGQLVSGCHAKRLEVED